MSNEIREPAPEVVACHEAGHLMVAFYCGRDVQKVSLDLIDGKRGCFYGPAADDWTDYHEFLTLLAGPRAQIALLRNSIEEWKFLRFREWIIQPTEQYFMIPEIYDYTGWEHDVRPIYEMLMLPDAPVLGLRGIVTRRQALQRAENGLREAFLVKEIATAVRELARILLERRELTHEQATETVKQTRVLDLPSLRQSLRWEAA